MSKASSKATPGEQRASRGLEVPERVTLGEITTYVVMALDALLLDLL
jgi:hypothetical protein